MTRSSRQPRGVADAQKSFRHVFVRDLKIMAMLGIHEHEKRAAQRVVVNIDLTVKENPEPLKDDISNVVSYERVVDHVKEIVGSGHVHLVETLAEMIAARCLENPWVTGVRVRVEKPDIIPEAGSVGVEIERLQ